MKEIMDRLNPSFYRFAISQDKIGWRRFVEGMASKKIASIQGTVLALNGSELSTKACMSGLITKLLEVSHGQWLYRNLKVHDKIAGVLATELKEVLQPDIEEQQDLGAEGLAEEDRCLLEINLEDLETTSGEKQTY